MGDEIDWVGAYRTPVARSVGLHVPIRNEHWPKRPDQFVTRDPMAVLARIWWAHGHGIEWLPASAIAWGRWHVRVKLDPPKLGRDILWLKPSDVRRSVSDRAPGPER